MIGCLFAIDPGPTESAWVVYDQLTKLPIVFAKESNEVVLVRLAASTRGTELAVEMIASYGMAVGATVFDTCVWIGRFIERWDSLRLANQKPTLVKRLEVKSHLCYSARATDANIRQAIIDRYGGKEAAIGRKASPGPLYGISKDVWAALGVAITATESKS